MSILAEQKKCIPSLDLRWLLRALTSEFQDGLLRLPDSGETRRADSSRCSTAAKDARARAAPEKCGNPAAALSEWCWPAFCTRTLKPKPASRVPRELEQQLLLLLCCCDALGCCLSFGSASTCRLHLQDCHLHIHTPHLPSTTLPSTSSSSPIAAITSSRNISLDLDRIRTLFISDPSPLCTTTTITGVAFTNPHRGNTTYPRELVN
ncbi:hypothetical protein L1887_59336 [Cichorium endivia]|nr:hypothetical protein L1887_59336 [Cichorium endivia]